MAVFTRHGDARLEVELFMLVAAFAAKNPGAARARREGPGAASVVGVDQREPVRVVLDDGEVFLEGAQTRRRAHMRRTVLGIGRSLVIDHGEAACHMGLESGMTESCEVSCH